jgi:transposase
VSRRAHGWNVGNKTDAADAEAICEVVRRPSMRFVPLKNIEQQATLALHRAPKSFVKARTAQANQIRGLLSEPNDPAISLAGVGCPLSSNQITRK